MGYSAGEARLLAIVQAVTGYSTSNTSRANWKILDTGRAATYAIITHAGTTTDFFTLACYRDIHTAAVEIWQRYKNDGFPLPPYARTRRRYHLQPDESPAAALIHTKPDHMKNTQMHCVFFFYPVEFAG